ncbi:unnamed protein product [Rhizophagus irregularis]|nr:unnamed protein product [Rhizophagus irregularis]
MLDCETDNTNTKSLEDGKTMLSWDEVHKKKVSNEIRQRKREEKFQRESSDHKQENIGYNNSSNDSGERIPEESIHSEDVKMTLCYQNDAIPPASDDTTSEVFESENQIVESLVQELTCVEWQ